MGFTPWAREEQTCKLDPKFKVPKVPKVPLLQVCLKSIGFHQCKDFRFNAGDCLFDSISYLLREKCIKNISSCALRQECINKLRHDVEVDQKVWNWLTYGSVCWTSKLKESPKNKSRSLNNKAQNSIMCLAKKSPGSYPDLAAKPLVFIYGIKITE